MTQIYTILFDLDGTIVDTAPDLMAAHNHVMRKFGHDEKKLDDIKSLAGKDNKNKEINRLLGKDPLQGLSKLGLSADWAVNVIGQVGNYAEVFEKNLGMSTPLKIARGANQLSRDGGLFYIPPIK